MAKTIIEKIHDVASEFFVANPGESISLKEIISRIHAKFGTHNEDTIRRLTNTITVNCDHRGGNYLKGPHVAEQPGKYDFLFQPVKSVGNYEKYDPSLHGIWGIVEGDDTGKWVVRKIEPPEVYFWQPQILEEYEGEADDEQDDEAGVIAFPQPSVSEVKEKLLQWSKMENYQLQEKCIRKLFDVTHPDNKDRNEILTKVAVLNDFYSTNIKIPKPLLAEHIRSLTDLDTRFKQGDPTVVHEIADKEKLGIRYYSFATKYAHHHNPEKYPIFDRYVSQVLRYFRKKGGLSKFKNADLKDYPQFKEIIEEFCRQYGLTQFSVQEIDKFLWLLGRNVSAQK